MWVSPLLTFKVQFLLLSLQIHDTKNCFMFNGDGVDRWLCNCNNSSDLEQMGPNTRMRIRSNLLPVVHGRCHHTGFLTCLVVHAFRILSDMARSIEASEATSYDRATGRNIRLEICSSKILNCNCIISLHMEIAFLACFACKNHFVSISFAFKGMKRRENCIRAMAKSFRCYESFTLAYPLKTHKQLVENVIEL
jgi:hypothetical protein